MSKKRVSQKAIETDAATREVFMLRIRQARRDARITQSELARRVGATQGCASRWFTGSSLPEASYLPAIARELRVTTDWLLGLDDRTPDEVIKEHFRLMKLEKAVWAFCEDLGGVYEIPLVQIEEEQTNED